MFYYLIFSKECLKIYFKVKLRNLKKKMLFKKIFVKTIVNTGVQYKSIGTVEFYDGDKSGGKKFKFE